MNILFISGEYPPQTGFGGIGTYTRIAASMLASRGHGVRVIALSETGAPYTHMDGAVRVHRVAPGTFPLPQGRLCYPYRRLCYATIYNTLVRRAFARSAAICCQQLLSETAFDIIEAPECGAEGFYLPYAEGTHRVVRLHTPWEMAARLDRIDQGGLDIRATGRMERAVAQRAAGVSSPTRALSALLSGRWGLRNVRCYPNPLDTDQINEKSAHGDYILYTGRVECRKGVHLLVQAYAELVKGGLTLPLRLVGAPYGVRKDGTDYGASIEGLIRAHGLEKKILWMKKADRSEVKSQLQNARFAVFPSLWENYPYACLEAMASSVPVVAARVGGYPEIIEEGKSGLLFAAEDPADLAVQMKRLLVDRALVRDLGPAARARVIEQCAPNVVAPQAEAFYTEAMHG
ncbi:MAG: glycosyltransferase family 4 protein [Fibrobacterota bacterium]